MNTRTSHRTGKACWNQHFSESPHVGVENVFDERSVEFHLAQRQGVDACDASGVSPFFFFFRLDLPRDLVIKMTEWICRWNPLWIPTGDTFQKTFLEESGNGLMRDNNVTLASTIYKRVPALLNQRIR